MNWRPWKPRLWRCIVHTENEQNKTKTKRKRQTDRKNEYRKRRSLLRIIIYSQQKVKFYLVRLQRKTVVVVVVVAATVTTDLAGGFRKGEGINTWALMKHRVFYTALFVYFIALGRRDVDAVVPKAVVPMFVPTRLDRNMYFVTSVHSAHHSRLNLRVRATEWI